MPIALKTKEVLIDKNESRQGFFGADQLPNHIYQIVRTPDITHTTTKQGQNVVIKK